jgi:hypothetical protein
MASGNGCPRRNVEVLGCSVKLKWYIMGAVGLLAVVVAMYLARPHLKAMRDRDAVSSHRLDPATAAEAPLQDDGGAPSLTLRHDKAIRVGENIVIYSRSVSHHNGVPLFRGYTFVNVNGSVWHNRTGPCCSSAMIPFPGRQIQDIDEHVIKDALRKRGYTEIFRVPGYRLSP